MKEDPFGNLREWGSVLEIFDRLSENGELTECQSGLIRILRYKGNWRLREVVLKCLGDIQTPSKELLLQVLTILSDDNIYYDARILAGDGLAVLLKNARDDFSAKIVHNVIKTVEKLRSTPQPPFFEKALKRLHSEVGRLYLLQN